MRLVGRVGHACAPVLEDRSLQIPTHPTPKLSLKFAGIIMSQDENENCSSRDPHTPIFSGECGPPIGTPPRRLRRARTFAAIQKPSAARRSFYARAKNYRSCSRCFLRSAVDWFFLGLPPGLPDLPLTNRVALPAACSLSYRPSVEFSCAGEERLSDESAMVPPIVG
jgi:hypothetical protein